MNPVEVITLGELLIDFVPTVSGVTLIEAPAFKKAPGGAPANVAVGLARLGVRSGFMGKVGDDAFGWFLAQTLSSEGVDTSGLRFSQEARTMLAFVSLRVDGERDFMFYRHPSADMLYSPQEIDPEYLRQAQIFHFGSISLISEPSRSATLHAIQIARQSGALISYDPNLRLNLWPDAESARAGIRQVWELAHVIKVSEEEVHFLSNQTDLSQGVKALWHDELRLMVVTRGAMGCTCATVGLYETVPGFSVETVDTTGAGDGFVAGMLKGLLAHHGDWEEKESMREILIYANAVGALTTTQRGAIPALPTHQEVAAYLAKN